MLLLATRAGTRAILRRPPPSRNPLQAPRTKRHQSTNSGIKEDPAVTTGTAIPVPNTVATLPLWQRLGLLSKGFQAYGRSQRKRPYTTQFVSSLVIYFLGDLSAQKMNGDDYDPRRTARALVISAGSSIPSYKWFLFLGNNFNYPSKALSLLTKVVVNQIMFTPLFNTYFFGMQSLLSGDSLPDVWERITRTVPTSIKNSCKLWPAVTAFSFTFIDPQYRSIFAGVIAIGWQTYLSFLNRRAEVEGALQKGMGMKLEEVREREISSREGQRIEA